MNPTKAQLDAAFANITAANSGSGPLSDSQMEDTLNAIVDYFKTTDPSKPVGVRHLSYN